MANANKPAGLQPVQYRNGNPWSGQARTYWIPQTDTNSYAIGDPVTMLAAGGDTNGVPGCVLATAGTGNVILGAIVGLGRYEAGMFDPSNLDRIIVPATKTYAYYAMVADDPDILFEVQEGNSATYLTAGAVNLNANLYAGVNNGYVSGWTVDNTSTGTATGLQLKLLGLTRKTDNSFGQYAKWLVGINNHIFSGGTAGV